MNALGRPRHEHAIRFECGKIDPKRLSPQEVADNQSVVLSQPHRLGEKSQMSGDNAGRILLEYLKNGTIGIDEVITLYNAADRFRRVCARKSALDASKRPYASSEGRAGPEMTIADIQEIEQNFGDVRRCLRDMGDAVEAAVYKAVIELEPSTPISVINFYIKHNLPIGLRALQRMWG